MFCRVCSCKNRIQEALKSEWQQLCAGYMSVTNICMCILLCIWMAYSVAWVTLMIRTSICSTVNPTDVLCWGISLWQRSCYAANRRLPCWEATAGPVKQISLLWVTGHLPLPPPLLTSPRSSLAKIVLTHCCNHSWFLTCPHSAPSLVSHSLASATSSKPRHCSLCCLLSFFPHSTRTLGTFDKTAPGWYF